MTNLQTFKFVFTAYLGEMNIKAKISSPTFVTWKRSINLYNYRPVIGHFSSC